MITGDPPPAETPADPAGRLDRTRVTVTTGPLLGPVLARLVGIHAARAGLTVDRLEDAVLVTDALADCAGDVLRTGRLPLSIQSSPGRIELRFGPLPPGAARELIERTALPDTGPLMHMLADEVHVRAGAGGDEVLVVRVMAAAPPAPGARAG